MKKVLIYFSEFNPALGGGEFTPLSFISELQKSCQVTLALNWQSDVALAAEKLRIPIDLDRLRIEYVKPSGRILQRLDSVLPFYRTKRLKELAEEADICISTVNMFDFGKPAHHFVYLLRQFGDNAFCDYLGGRGEARGVKKLLRKLKTFVGEAFLRPLLGVRSTRKILADRRERIYPNSFYVEKVMRDFYGDFNGSVFYPPTIFEFSRPAGKRDALRIVVLGHLFPEKRILDIIEIVDGARRLSGADLVLALGGPVPDSPYAEKIRALAAEKCWIQLAGPLYGGEKEDFLLSGTYAVHGERDEAFGISVTEYLKGGLIPVVPDEGGPCEIVDDADLSYHTPEEGSQILAKLVSSSSFREEKKAHCRLRAEQFTREAYLEKQHLLLNGILEEAEKGEKK